MSALASPMYPWQSSGSLLTSILPAGSAPAPVAFTEEPNASWQQDAIERLVELTNLPMGWDGYSAKPVSTSTAGFALKVLSALSTYRAPRPAIVPLSYGGLQFEWHRKGWDVEIEVEAPLRAHFWAREISSGSEIEHHIEADLGPLKAFIAVITD